MYYNSCKRQKKILNIQFKKNNTTYNKNLIIKFCVFAGRKNNIEILDKYIILLFEEKIIDEYHVFDFTRNNNDKEFLYESYLNLKHKYKKVFIHNNENNIEINKYQYNWSPFYKIISKKKFYDNSIIIKCDDDILFIDIYGLKNAINERKKDKKSFLIHSNCINNNICTYYQKDFFPNIQDKLNTYPEGGILGPIFENPILAYIIQYQFISDCIKDINKIQEYYLNDIYIKTRISINFIILNGEDCKYFKDTSFSDEYELSSYYPEKLCRPNKIIGNFITCHYSYSMQEKILNKKKELKLLYQNLYDKYLLNYKLINYNYTNILINNYKVNKLGKNKFFIKNFNKNKYSIRTEEGDYLYINYFDTYLTVNKQKKTFFDIKFIEKHKIIIKLGIYNFNKFNLCHEFKNRNLFIKLLYQFSENLIELIPKNNGYFMKFIKYNFYINLVNKKIQIEEKPSTIWILKKNNDDEHIFVKRYINEKKIYYKNMRNNENFTNFYLGWGCENIINIL